MRSLVLLCWRFPPHLRLLKTVGGVENRRRLSVFDKKMYVSPNFKTKKALKEAIAKGNKVEVYSPGPFSCEQNGTVSVEGPHYPEPHKWYASVEVKDGLVVKVKS